MQGKSLDEARMSYYLPKVVDEALKMHHVEIFVGDMIQEGNISLMMALDECKEGQEDEEAVMEAVRAGMQALLESQTETRDVYKRQGLPYRSTKKEMYWRIRLSGWIPGQLTSAKR